MRKHRTGDNRGSSKYLLNSAARGHCAESRMYLWTLRAASHASATYIGTWTRTVAMSRRRSEVDRATRSSCRGTCVFGPGANCALALATGSIRRLAPRGPPLKERCSMLTAGTNATRGPPRMPIRARPP